MTHRYLLVTRYDDGRERSTRHRTVSSARERVERREAAGDRVRAALVLEDRKVVARYTRWDGWKGDEAA